MEPPTCSGVISTVSGGKGSRHAIGTDGGVATGRSSLIVLVVVLMVSVMMVMAPPTLPVVMAVVLFFKFELFLIHTIPQTTKIIYQ